MLGESHAGLDLVAHATTFLLVGVDPFAALRGDMLETEELIKCRGEHRLTPFAAIGTVAIGNGMKVSASWAELGLLGEKPIVLLDGQDHAVDLIARTFVVEDRS